MPTYDYRCNACGNEFEVFQKMSDEPVKVCPKCGGEVKKLFSGGAGIHFKGSGFYVTDYKKSGFSSGHSGSAHPAGCPDCQAKKAPDVSPSNTSTNTSTDK